MTSTRPRKPAKAVVEATMAPTTPLGLDTAPATDPNVAPPVPTGAFEGSSIGTAVRDVSAPFPPPLDESGAGIAAAGWVYGRKITNIWSYDASTGVWVWVDGIGWKRLSPDSESGHSHMTVLCSTATHDNLPVDYHEDASGRIDQLLV